MEKSEKINSLSSIEGRQILREIFRELRFERQRGALSSLVICWRIAAYETSLNKFSGKNMKVLYPLGFFGGTSIWMQEVVNRFYFSTINSFVYFGAAVLLVLVGLRQFTETLDNRIVIAGIVFEALMLLFMFLVMIFTPPDESNGSGTEETESGELLTEIGEIGRDFAAVVVQLEQLTLSINNLNDNQSKLLEEIKTIAKSSADAVAPNPKMLEIMDETNKSLGEFKGTLVDLNDTAKKLRHEEIQAEVKKQLAEILANRLG
jgi:hypothetical protein